MSREAVDTFQLPKGWRLRFLREERALDWNCEVYHQESDPHVYVTVVGKASAESALRAVKAAVLLAQEAGV